MNASMVKLSKAEHVRGILTNEIMSGRLLPGEKLIEENIAARLHCSRTPVREALRHLDATGLIQFKPRHGAIVAGPSGRVAFDLFDTMIELEATCADLAAQRLTDDDRKRLGKLVVSEEAEDDLFAILHAAADNPVLVDLVCTIRLRLMPHLRRMMPESASLCMQPAILQSVIEAVISGDGAAARAAMRAHVTAGHPPQLP